MIRMSGTTRSVDRVMSGHGGGGELMARLIRDHMLPRLGNERLNALTDGAVLPWVADSHLVFTTDSFVVTVEGGPAVFDPVPMPLESEAGPIPIDDTRVFSFYVGINR